MRCALIGLAFLASCSGSGKEPVQLRDVVDERIATLTAELPAAAATPELAEDLREDVIGNAIMLSSDSGQMRAIILETIREYGPGAAPVLSVHLAGEGNALEERTAAAELLAILDTPVAARALMQQAEKSGNATIRAHCFWNLSKLTQDEVLTRLLLRLKYETDPEAVIWLATALGHFQNYSGLELLIGMSANGATQALRDSAATQVAALAAGAEDSTGATLLARWTSVDADLIPQETPSVAARLAVWKQVADLGEEHFQLRGVDDARFVLARLGSWAVPLLCEALFDTDVYVRLHCAQVLERMGPRATGAGPALMRALEEPRLAPAAAEALGSVGHPPAEPALRTLTETGHDHELRVAAVRALGRLGLSDSVSRLRELFDAAEEPTDLRMECATALVWLRDGARVADWLNAELVRDGADAEGAELALTTWLWMGKSDGKDGYAAAWDTWTAAEGPPGVILKSADVQKRQAQRAAALAALLDSLE